MLNAEEERLTLRSIHYIVLLIVHFVDPGFSSSKNNLPINPSCTALWAIPCLVLEASLQSSLECAAVDVPDAKVLGSVCWRTAIGDCDL